MQKSCLPKKEDYLKGSLKEYIYDYGRGDLEDFRIENAVNWILDLSSEEYNKAKNRLSLKNSSKTYENYSSRWEAILHHKNSSSHCCLGVGLLQVDMINSHSAANKIDSCYLTLPDRYMLGLKEKISIAKLFEVYHIEKYFKNKLKLHNIPRLPKAATQSFLAILNDNLEFKHSEIAKLLLICLDEFFYPSIARGIKEYFFQIENCKKL